MALSDAQIKNRCLAHCGARQCRYLVANPKKWGNFNCAKLVPGMKKDIDVSANKIIMAARKAGSDPFAQWTPVGDGGSCNGYPFLPSLKQGYDVKNP